jgi:HK97 gp10 family phage protein
MTNKRTWRIVIDDKRLRMTLNDPMLIKGPVMSMLSKQGEMGAEVARRKAPKDTGKLRASIKAVRKGLRSVVTVGVPYGAFVEFGTRPHFPPVSALAGWAKRKGMQPILAAMAIAKHGTKAQPFLRPAAAAMRATNEAALVVAGKGIARRWNRG